MSDAKSTPTLAFSTNTFSLKAIPVINKATVKPTPPIIAAPTMCRRATPPNQAHRQPRKAGYAHNFTDNQPEHHSHRHRTGERLPDELTGKHHTGIHQRAMSVAIGMPQPAAPFPATLKTR